MKALFNQLKGGLILKNPVFVQLIGMCPTLAVSTELKNGLSMGLAVTFVLMFSNLVISIMRKVIPSEIRIAAFTVIIAGFVTIVDLSLKTYLPELSSSLGIFVPLIVVNCIVLARAEEYASKNKPLPSLIDGLAMGLGFTLAISALSTVREIIGTGRILGLELFSGYTPISLIVSPAGGFLTLGFLIAGFQHFMRRGENR